MYFGFMNVMLLYSDNRNVSATLVAIFSVVSAKNTNIFIVCWDHSTLNRNFNQNCTIHNC
jgi:hypothetical protein